MLGRLRDVKGGVALDRVAALVRGHLAGAGQEDVDVFGDSMDM
jgi:hypothetical protein